MIIKCFKGCIDEVFEDRERAVRHILKNVVIDIDVVYERFAAGKAHIDNKDYFTYTEFMGEIHSYLHLNYWEVKKAELKSVVNETFRFCLKEITGGEEDE